MSVIYWHYFVLYDIIKYTMKRTSSENAHGQAWSRYEDLIAYPEGGRGYQHETLSLVEFAQVLKWQAEAMVHNLGLLGLAPPQSLVEMLAQDDQDLMNIQMRQQFTWGEIGDVVVDLGFDYLQDAYALTSMKDPGERSSSE